ncbi:DUF1819 family protein [Lacticaseibacillus paracasei]|uniref:DUF1819 family protein n=1 Tax=Lacticaseibacillus paracasei TaxID=1597 RepID=UPI0040463342
MKKFSASFISRSFWFPEFSAVISMLNNGKDWDDITEAIIDDNIFKMSSKNRSTDLKKEMFLRSSPLPASFVELFEQLPLNNQKIMNLIAIMNARPLVEDFVLNVFKKELLTGDLRLEPYEISAYLQDLPLQHPETAHWTQQTLKKIQTKFHEILTQSGLAEDVGGAMQLKRALLEASLIAWLKQNGKSDYILALTGRAL